MPIKKRSEVEYRVVESTIHVTECRTLAEALELVRAFGGTIQTRRSPIHMWLPYED